MKKLLLILFMLSPSAMAGWSALGVVTDIYSHNGRVLIKTTLPDNVCPVPGGFWWSEADEDSKTMLSLALTSLTTGKKITVVYSNTKPNCDLNFTQITHLRLTNKT